MAKKKAEKPVRITYSEILNLAIEQLTARIEPYKEKLAAAEDPAIKELVKSMIEPLAAKRAILAEYFRIETGAEYGLDFEED